MDFLIKMWDFVNVNLMASATVVALIVEFLFRVVPSEKPKSIAWVVRDVIYQVSLILGKIAEFLDKILGQRIVK